MILSLFNYKISYAAQKKLGGGVVLTLIHEIDYFMFLFKDYLFRFGAAYLYSDNIQIEATLGASTKNTPSSILANIGVSYRLDFHKDFISAEEKQAKEFIKQEKKLNKTLKKNTKTERKRNRKAKKN